MSLTDLECRKAPASEKLTKLSDMGGLQLWVYPNGTKAWRFAYRFGGKQKLLTLGRYPATTLLEARMGRDNAKVLLDGGSDPSHVKKLARLESEFPG
ncbi:MAG TPA: Arm DNA-binding domain-containing protein, partial [Rhizomicrobium sp.]|nr:Arm DNA-binding domain-containing protein [Rhizomicrobium sp.]